MDFGIFSLLQIFYTAAISLVYACQKYSVIHCLKVTVVYLENLFFLNNNNNKICIVS